MTASWATQPTAGADGSDSFREAQQHRGVRRGRRNRAFDFHRARGDRSSSERFTLDPAGCFIFAAGTVSGHLASYRISAETVVLTPLTKQAWASAIGQIGWPLACEELIVITHPSGSMTSNES
jgi:hypothetical protein